MKIFKRKFIFLGIIFVLFSCTGSKVLKAEKFEVLPGIASASSYYRYKVTIDVTKETEFKSIELNTSNVLEKFSVINFKTKIQGDNKKRYEKGKYNLQFDVPKKNDSQNSKDILKIKYIQNNKPLFLSIKIDTVRVLKLR